MTEQIKVTPVSVEEDITQRLKNATSMSEKARQHIIDYYKTDNPSQLTQCILESILADYYFHCLKYSNKVWLPIGAEAVVISEGDQRRSFFLASELDIDRQNRLKLRLIANLALNPDKFARPYIGIFDSKKTKLQIAADRWIGQLIDKQFSVVATVNNPFMQGILQATYDLRQPTLRQKVTESITNLSNNSRFLYNFLRFQGRKLPFIDFL